MGYKVVKNINEFEEVIKKGKVFIDFFANWCGPCKMLAPFFEELSNENNEVTFVKIDTDVAQDVAQKLEVMSIPTLVLYENGELKDKHVGFMPKDKMIEFIK